MMQSGNGFGHSRVQAHRNKSRAQHVDSPGRLGSPGDLGVRDEAKEVPKGPTGKLDSAASSNMPIPEDDGKRNFKTEGDGDHEQKKTIEEQKRLSSRISSRLSQERKRKRLEELYEDDHRLKTLNATLRAENEELGAAVRLLKNSMINGQSTMPTMMSAPSVAQLVLSRLSNSSLMPVARAPQTLPTTMNPQASFSGRPGVLDHFLVKQQSHVPVQHSEEKAVPREDPTINIPTTLSRGRVVQNDMRTSEEKTNKAPAVRQELKDEELLEQRRLSSRLSSRRNQERNLKRIEYLSEEKERLSAANDSLRSENESIRNAIKQARKIRSAGRTRAGAVSLPSLPERVGELELMGQPTSQSQPIVSAETTSTVGIWNQLLPAVAPQQRLFEENVAFGHGSSNLNVQNNVPTNYLLEALQSLQPLSNSISHPAYNLLLQRIAATPSPTSLLGEARTLQELSRIANLRQRLVSNQQGTVYPLETTSNPVASHVLAQLTPPPAAAAVNPVASAQQGLNFGQLLMMLQSASNRANTTQTEGSAAFDRLRHNL